MRLRLTLATLALSLSACHHSSGHGAADMAESPDLSPVYPALAAPDVPQVANAGGPILVSPQVVVITFAGDDSAPQIEDFVGKLGATAYWTATTAEYGVGPLSLYKTIHVTEPAPTTITDEQIQAWLSTQLDPATQSGWPQPSSQTIYAIFYPATTTITQGQSSKSCSTFGGYHSDTGISTGTERVIYAVLPRCNHPLLGPFGYLTGATSHELVEAVTDPFPQTNPAYTTVDPSHAIWARIFGGGETGDLCAQEPTADFKPDGFGYYVQRSWSNVAAAAGQDPCVPAVATPPYFNIAPTSPPGPLTISFMGFSFVTAGWTIPVGTSQTFEFQLYSSAATDPITVEATDLNGTALSFTWDVTTGINGDKLNLTINALKASSGLPDGFAISAKIGATTHNWFGLVDAVAQ